MRLHAIATLLDELAPPRLAATWDNPGWQIRLENDELHGVLLAVDAAPTVVDEARELGANLLITHHPLFFRPPRSLDAADLVGATALAAARAGLSIFTAHTNLDASPGGTSAALAEALGLGGGEVLSPGPEPGTGYGMVVHGTSRTLAGWAKLVELRLGSAPLALSGDPDREHSTVAVMGGSGGGELERAVAAGASLYLTADIRYHEAQQARAVGLSLIVLDHFASERPVLDRVARFLGPRLPCPVACSNRRTTPWEVGRP